MATPPLSLRGIYGALRAPTLRDVAYSSKAFAAAALALTAGFSQNLENPYWSVLTVYIIVNPPGAGAIRSKAIFRLLGTSIGGILVVTATSLCADQIGLLLATTIAIIVGGMFLSQIDKRPTGYLCFAVAVTTAVIALNNLSQPARIFALATARVGEISLGILIMAAVDCLLPELMTPPFLETLAGWRGQARDLVASVLKPGGDPPDEQDHRKTLTDLVRSIQMIDAKAIQLPFDVVPRAFRRRDLDLVRRQVVAMVARIVAIELRARALRRAGLPPLPDRRLLDALTAWMREDPACADQMPDSHIEQGRTIAAELEQARDTGTAAPRRAALLQRGLLTRLAAFVNDWCDLLLVLRAVQAGQRLPARLEQAAARAKPVRSIDYLGTALDLAPLLLAMSAAGLIWYLTAWENGPTSLLFSFAGCLVLVGQEQVLESTGGFLASVLAAFALVFLYQFVVLPRVTDFPVLLMVLGCAMLPLGVLMAMTPAGLVVATLTFSFLGLQDAYAADFAQSLQTLAGSLVGLLIAVGCQRVCAYDHARFASRRLAAAVRRDVIDVARAPRPPDPGRFGFLAFYRLSLYLPAAEQAAGGAPPPRLGLFGDLGVGYSLLGLRRHETAVSPGARNLIQGLRDGTASLFERKLAGRPDDGTLRALVDAAIADPAIQDDPAHDALLDDLASLDIVLDEPPPSPQPPP